MRFRALELALRRRKRIRRANARSDERLKTSALESLYGGQLISSTQLRKPNYLVILNAKSNRKILNFEISVNLDATD